MRDRQLEKNIARVEGFIEEWKQLSQFLDHGFQGDRLTDEEEAAFLELKSRIAQHYEVLMTTLGPDAEHWGLPVWNKPATPWIYPRMPLADTVLVSSVVQRFIPTRIG